MLYYLDVQDFNIIIFGGPIFIMYVSILVGFAFIIFIMSPVSEGSGDVMVLRRSRPPPAMVLTR